MIWISMWFLLGRKRKINVEKRTSGTQGRQETAEGGHDIFSSNSMDWLYMYKPHIFPYEQSNIFFSNPLSVWGPCAHLVPLLYLGLREFILLQGVYLISLLVVATVNLFSIFPSSPRSLRELQLSFHLQSLSVSSCLFAFIKASCHVGSCLVEKPMCQTLSSFQPTAREGGLQIEPLTQRVTWGTLNRTQLIRCSPISFTSLLSEVVFLLRIIPL